MNYQSPYQNPLNTMTYQFQNMAFPNNQSYTGANGDVSIERVDSAIVNPISGQTLSKPLSRSTSLLDSLGVQRTTSPFVQNQQRQDHLGSVQDTRASSLLNGLSATGTVDASIHESSSSSPYPSHLGTPSAVSNGTPLFSAVPPPIQGGPMPPGVGNAQLPIILKSQWKYIDTQGQIQGPFDSDSMSQWYASGYFQPFLQVARVGTSLEPFGINDRFITLGELISKVNDFQEPFNAFDIIISSAAAAAAGFPSINGKLPSLGENGQTTSLTQQPQVTNVHSDDYTHDEILNLKNKDGSYYHEVVVQIPVSKSNLEKLDVDAKLDTSIPTTGIRNVQEEVTGKNVQRERIEITEREANGTLNSPEISIDHHQYNLLSNADKAKEAELKRQQKAEDMAKKLLDEQQRQEEELKKMEELRKLKKQQKQKIKEQQESSTKNKVKKDETDSKNTPLVEAEITIESSSTKEVKSPLAPWANKVKNIAPSKISLSELREKEELEQAKRTQERELKERAAALKWQEDILKEDKAQKEIKSVLTWASKPAPPPVVVDIKPQLKKSVDSHENTKNKNKFNHSDSEPLKEFKSPSFIEEQRHLWEEAQRSGPKRHTTTTTTTYTTNTINEWTTITSKATNTANQPKPAYQPKSYVSPDKLRAVASGGSNAKQIGSSTSIPSLRAKYIAPTTYPGNASISVRQEFLRWCRSQMKLNAKVEVNSVLEVLLSLPAGSEAKEIIADTIYSNSSTMDGRRFATEFIKRRLECEKQVKDPLTWSEALALPEGNEDDWEFQVVSKKKGRKHRAE